MKSLTLINEIGNPIDNALYIDLINGKFSPPDRLKSMHYFAFEAHYTKQDVEDAYRQRINLLVEQSEEFLNKLKMSEHIFILTLNGQPTLYSDIFLDEIKKYLE